MDSHERLEKIEELVRIVAVAWQDNGNPEDHHTLCFMVHPNCLANQIIGILED